MPCVALDSSDPESIGLIRDRRLLFWDMLDFVRRGHADYSGLILIFLDIHLYDGLRKVYDRVYGDYYDCHVPCDHHDSFLGCCLCERMLRLSYVLRLSLPCQRPRGPA